MSEISRELHMMLQAVLREAVPMWLTSGRLAEYVVSISAAPQALGGAGAYYVVLRRATHGKGPRR